MLLTAVLMIPLQAFQSTLMALSLQEELSKERANLESTMSQLNHKYEEKVKTLAAEIAKVKADVVEKEVALSNVQDELNASKATLKVYETSLKVSDAALKTAEASLKTSEEAIKGNEVMLHQYVMDAGNMAEYYSQDTRIQMMEEYNEGLHQSWDLAKARMELSETYPEGVPGDALLSKYMELRGPVDEPANDDSIDSELETSPP